MRCYWWVAVSCFTLSGVLHAKGKTSRPSPSSWGEPRVTGEIESALLPEASGLAQSRANRSHLFHVNDAGSTPSFVVTDLDGSQPQKVNLEVDAVTDTEDLAVGECPDGGSCLYIADIGDNKFRRSHVTLHVVRDRPSFEGSVSPVFSATLKYDDGASHNAESFAIHPSGFGYVLTKESPAQLFRFAISSLQTSDAITLEKVGTLDVTPWLAGTDKPKKIVPTSMDIRPDGRQLVILTRAAGISIDIDLVQDVVSNDQSLNELIRSKQIAVERLPMIQLPQSEAVTYLDDGSAILYSSEIVETGGSTAPLIEVSVKS